MWQTTLCPKFAFKTFTFINVVVQIAIFFVSVTVSGTEEEGLNKHIFLGNNFRTLDEFGMRMPLKIAEDGQV